MSVETNKINDDQLNRPLLEVKGLRIEGLSEKGWEEIVCGVDLQLKRGEILGLIGESGAGKSTIGLASMGYARDGCRITAGEIIFDGINLQTASENEGQPTLFHLEECRSLCLYELRPVLSPSIPSMAAAITFIL